MEAFLRFIFIVFIIFYGIKLFVRFALPWLLARFMKKQQDKFNNMSGFPNNNQNRTKDGEVHIKTKPSNNAKDDSDFGEYVDFEDVKE